LILARLFFGPETLITLCFCSLRFLANSLKFGCTFLSLVYE